MTAGAPATTPATVVDRSALMHTYAEPTVTFVRGEGSTLYDTEGRPYLDFLSGLAVTSLGHAHPVVAEADRRPGPHAQPRLQPVRQRWSGPRWPSPWTG